eukprot:gene6964-12586_t
MRSKILTEVESAQINETVVNDTRENEPEERVEDVEEVEDGAENVVVPNAVENAPEHGLENDEEQKGKLNQEEVVKMRTDILEELSLIQHAIINERESLLKIRHTNKYRNIIEVGNEALKQLCEETDPNLTELNELIYATGKVIQKRCGVKPKRKKRIVCKPSKPKWQVKIDKEIENHRKEISLLEELQEDKEIKSDSFFYRHDSVKSLEAASSDSLSLDESFFACDRNPSCRSVQRSEKGIEVATESIWRKVAFRSCCDALKQSDTEEGIFLVHPDKVGHPVEVKCIKDNGSIKVVFDHNSERKISVNGYERPDLFKQKILYKNQLQNIIRFVDLSQSCRQFTRIDCHNMVLFYNVYVGYLVDRKGKRIDHIGGGPANGRVFILIAFALGDSFYYLNVSEKPAEDGSLDSLNIDESFFACDLNPNCRNVNPSGYGSEVGTGKSDWKKGIYSLECHITQ